MNMLKIEKWDMFEACFKGTQKGNPYTEVHVKGIFIHDTDYVEVEGFYDGEGIYKLRFMPTSLGCWTYTIRSNDLALDGQKGELECIEPSEGNHGPVLVKNKFNFAYADGSRHFSVGTTCYAWIYQDENIIEKTFETLKKNAFNKIRMCVFPKHYDYNRREPKLLPYLKDENGKFDYTKYNTEFFAHFDNIIERLCSMGIEADIILFHPYDRWGFMRMGRESDERYLKYMIARYAAYRNIWWSMANEYDLFTQEMELPEDDDLGLYQVAAVDKEITDWDRLFHVIQSHDPYEHLRSIHNWKTFYDYGKPWITHCSVQRLDTFRTAECVTEWRELYQKPIVYDECAYEGNIDWGWGNISGQEMTRRFWEGVLRGGHMGHGETYMHPENILWWSHGGELHGTSPERIKFLKQILEETPNEKDLEPFNEGFDVTVGGVKDEYYIHYFGFYRPSWRKFRMKKGINYRVEIIDTWDMTITEVDGVFNGTFNINLPGKEYIAVRFKAV